MNEINKILNSKEKIIYEGKPKFIAFFTRLILTTIIASMVVGISMYFVLNSIFWSLIIGIIILISGIILCNLTYKRTYYMFTNERAIIQSGIIGRDFKSIDYDKMQNVSVKVGILGVIFKVGDIRIFTGEIESVGGGKDSAPTIQPKYDQFCDIDYPYEILKKLQKERSNKKH